MAGEDRRFVNGHLGKEEEPAFSPAQVLVQRRDTLQELVDHVTMVYEPGSIEAANVIDARDELVDVQLEIAEKTPEQIWEEHLQYLRKIQQFAEVNVRRGAAPKSEILRVKAAVLQALIELERVRNK